MRLSKLLLVPLLAAGAAPAFASACDCAHQAHALTVAAADRAPAAGTAKKGVRTIDIAVTSEGFTPAVVTAKAGETVKLVVTRKTDKTCAKEIVMKDFGVNQPLPLDKPVTVTVKPTKAGDYRFACGMDMIAGTLEVQ